MTQPLVKNAADEEQVKDARRKERFGRERELEDVRVLLGLKEGRRFLARILSECRVHQSVWHPSAAIHKNAGIQEVGHFVMKEITAADPKAASVLLIEAYQRELGGNEDV